MWGLEQGAVRCGAHRGALACSGQGWIGCRSAHALLCRASLYAFLIGMADTSGHADTKGSSGSTTGPGPRKSSWKYIGPGIVVAATGVGAGDLVATLIAGSNFGYTLLWAAVIGCLVKISLAEAAGRWHLSTGRTLFDGWASLGDRKSVV